jgi:hypothetical protein
MTIPPKPAPLGPVPPLTTAEARNSEIKKSLKVHDMSIPPDPPPLDPVPPTHHSRIEK